MSLFKKLFCFFGFVLFVTQAYSQNFVWINPSEYNYDKPSEVLDVNGTMRVRRLPVNNEANGIHAYGMVDDYSSDIPLTTFVARYAVVANQDGVLGRANLPAANWFYMPPMNLPVSIDDPRYSADDQFFTVNLHEEYQRQFSLPPGASAATAGATSLQTFSANELDYYVTYYDHSVFQDVSLTDQGILKYKIKTLSDLTPDTFFTVIFRVR